MAENETLKRIHEINLEMLLAVDEICKRHDIRCFLCFGALLGAVRHRDFIPWDNDIDMLLTRDEFDRLLPYLKAELDTEKYEVVMPADYGKKYFDTVPRVNYKKADIRMDEGYTTYYEGKANKIVLDFFLLDRVPQGIRGKLHVFRLKALYGMLNSKRYELKTENYPGILKLAAHVLALAGKPFSADTLRRHTEKLCRKYDARTEITTYRVTNDNLHSFEFEIPEAYIASAKPVPIREYEFMAPTGAEEILTMWYGDYMKLPPEEERIPHWGNLLITDDNFVFYE